MSQLLRCELDGAHADLVSDRRRAAEEAREAAGKAKEREGALQARMRARLRMAEAEAAAAEKRLVDFKRQAQKFGLGCCVRAGSVGGKVSRRACEERSFEVHVLR